MLVCQINEHCKLTAVDRGEAHSQDFAAILPLVWQGAMQALKFVCFDMWKQYLKVITKKDGGAVDILDRFHIMAHLSKAIDDVCLQ